MHHLSPPLPSYYIYVHKDRLPPDRIANTTCTSTSFPFSSSSSSTPTSIAKSEEAEKKETLVPDGEIAGTSSPGPGSSTVTERGDQGVPGSSSDQGRPGSSTVTERGDQGGPGSSNVTERGDQGRPGSSNVTERGDQGWPGPEAPVPLSLKRGRRTYEASSSASAAAVEIQASSTTPCGGADEGQDWALWPEALVSPPLRRMRWTEEASSSTAAGEDGAPVSSAPSAAPSGTATSATRAPVVDASASTAPVEDPALGGGGGGDEPEVQGPAQPFQFQVAVAEPEPVPEIHGGEPPVAVHAAPAAAVAQGNRRVPVVGRPHMKRRLADEWERLEPHLPRPSPVSDESRLVVAGAIINERLGGLHPLLPPGGRQRIWLLLPHTNNRRGYDLLMNAAADFLEQHPPAPALD